MTDKTYNRISQFAGLAMLLFGAVAAFDWLGKVTIGGEVSLTQIFTGLSVLAGVMARWAAQQLPAAKVTKANKNNAGLLVLLVLAVGLMLSACPGGLAPGYRALTVSVKVTNEGGKVLASVCKAKRLACVDKLGTEDKAALRECLGNCPAALKHWVQVVKPAVGSGVEVTFRALEQARAGKDADWIESLRGWGCTLIRAVTLWRDLLGAKAQTYLNLLTSVEGWICK